MRWTRLRDQVGHWGPMAFCAVLSLGAFYLLILFGASLSKVILLGVLLFCPAIYFIAWFLGDNSGGGRRATLVPWGADGVDRQDTRLQQPTSAPRGWRARVNRDSRNKRLWPRRGRTVTQSPRRAETRVLGTRQ
jgi:hypothetical protein